VADPRAGDSALSRLLRRLREFVDAAGEPRFVLIACGVGALTGGVAVALAEAIHAIQKLAIGSAGPAAEVLGGLAAWQVVLAPMAGGLVVGCIGAFAHEVRGHGVPDVMEAVALRGGRLPRRAALTKWLATAVTIGSGGSVGREGPIAHIGAIVGSAVGQLLRLPANRLRTLAAAGAAGGIAAAFNAPIAGAFFALEVIARNFATHTFAPVVLCAVIATGVSRQYFGAAPAFEVPPLALGGIAEAPLAALLGIFCGFVSLAFMMVLRGLERVFERMPVPGILKPALGGLALGGLLLLAPDLYGAGHGTMGAMLRGELAWQTLALLLILKPIATSTTLASGGSGGVFLPSLFVGGLAGGLFVTAAHLVLPPLDTSHGAYVLIGMAAVLAGTSHAPITALLLALEATQSYAVILPVMMAVALSTLVARALRRDSIYTEKLTARGLDLDRREDVVLRGVRVREVMSSDPPAVREQTPLDAVLGRFLEGQLDVVFVLDGRDRPLGQVTIHDVKGVISEGSNLGGLVVARDVCESTAIASVDEDVAAALDRLTRTGRETLAVVDAEGALVGMLSAREITELIAREALRGEVLGVSQARPEARSPREALRLSTGINVRALPVPVRLVGETVASLEVRARFAVSVLSLRRDGVDRGVDPLRPLEDGDTLVLMGDVPDLDRFARWFT
jgi:CIC family chloride channel protein